jgi:hypothetical protein
MKNWKNCVLFGMVAIIVFSIVFVGCDDGNKETNPKREFKDLIFLGKNITLIDESDNSKDLKERGIWKRMQDVFNAWAGNTTDAWGQKFIAIYNTGKFAVVIRGGNNNNWAVTEEFKIIIYENHFSENDEWINDYIADAVSDNMPTP